MALPKISQPVFETVLPITGISVRFRPWLVGDKKAMLIAMQDTKTSTISNTVLDVIKRCLLDEVAIDTLPSTDIAWLTLQIKKNSDTDKITFNLTIKDCPQGGCVQPFALDLDTVEVLHDPTHTKKIALTDTIGVVMRYPTLAQSQRFFGANTAASSADAVNAHFDMLALCIETIWEGDNVYTAADTPLEDLREFIGSLSDVQFNKLADFLQTMPKLYKKIEFACAKCGKEIKYEAKGIHDFFV